MACRPNYHECKIEVKAVVPGSLSSFIYAYCKTINCEWERYFIRKAVSFSKLSKYVKVHITKDFDAWYRKHEDSQILFDVLSNLINVEEGRTKLYYKPNPNRKLISSEFYISGFNLPMILISSNIQK
jgi:hypothetical protein